MDKLIDEKLLPCPFCGGTPVIKEFGGNEECPDKFLGIVCPPDSTCAGTDIHTMSNQDAREKLTTWWNTRAEYESRRAGGQEAGFAAGVEAAAINMDWQQVVLNGGPPCFHLSEDGRFCGRAQRWDGHEDIHKFIGLDALIESIRQQTPAQGECVMVPKKDLEKAIKRMTSNGMQEWAECKMLKSMLAGEKK